MADQVEVNEALVQEYQERMADIKNNAKEALKGVQNLVTKIQEKSATNAENGLSFLELKNLTMLDYLSNLTYVMLRKVKGKSIEGDAAIERIVEDRTVLEKMRPIEKKLKYQIDKYLRVAETGDLRPDDPMHFKPNLEAFGTDDDDDDADDDEDEEGGDGGLKERKYVVPKHVPQFCDEDLSKQEVENEEKSKAKRKTLSKSILEDLKRQHLDTPEEEFNHADTMKAKHVNEMRERIRYEEENFLRLPTMSKKERHKRRKSMTTMGMLGDELTYFGSNNFYNQDSGGKKKRRASTGQGSARKKFKRR